MSGKLQHKTKGAFGQSMGQWALRGFIRYPNKDVRQRSRRRENIVNARGESLGIGFLGRLASLVGGGR